ncbi:PD-(D/E)XK nuclease domain-containing protein [Methanospirillum sp.]
MKNIISHNKLRNVGSNPESGYGRADIIMVPKIPKYPTAYLIEFKSINQNEDINNVCSQALAQIHEKVYSSAVHNAGIHLEQIRSLAIILQGKRVMVGEEWVGENS